MVIKDIVEYVMYTRGNTNRAVLTSMLKVLVSEIEPKGDETEVGSVAELLEAIESKDEVNLKLTNNLTISENLIIPQNKTINLNLSEYNINTNNKRIVVNGGTLSVEGNGSISGSGRPFAVTNSGHLIINGGHINSTNDTAIEAYQNGNVVINDGLITAQEVGVLVTTNSNVTMNGGEISTVDNFCIGGNGTSGKGGTTINITGGTLNGHIQSAGYVACGIYNPQDGIVNISGGEITGENGCGVLMRAGILNVTGGTIIGTGDPELKGKVGDSKVTVGPNGVIYDQLAHYPDSQNLEVNISGGIVIGSNISVDSLYDEGHEPNVNVTGGTQIPPLDEVIYYDGGDVEGNE